MVGVRLDYCNSVLYGTSQSNIAKLQRVRNCWHCYTQSEERDHITPILKDLNWLPIVERIDYKIALLTFKSLATHSAQLFT